MKLKLLVDMNLSPSWVDVFLREGLTASHWSAVGPASAKDQEIMAHAIQHGFVVLTHDLDFSRLLALTHAQGPSVIQVRAQDPLPETMQVVVLAAIRRHEPELSAGALVVIDETRSRVRVLPL